MKWNFFLSDDTTEMDFEGCKILIKCSPGKFKPEFVGDGMYCLNSKMHHIRKNLPKEKKKRDQLNDEIDGGSQPIDDKHTDSEREEDEDIDIETYTREEETEDSEKMVIEEDELEEGEIEEQRVRFHAKVFKNREKIS
jgi:hypothetical protein